MGFKRGEIVQFGSAHKWAGVLGIIEKVENMGDKARYMVAVQMPTGGAEDHGTAYIFAFDDDLLKLAIMDTQEKNTLYNWPDSMYPVSIITPFDPEEEEEGEG